MDIKSFKLIKNKQRPEFCYSYEKNTGDEKIIIFTMNGGKTFNATIETKCLSGRYLVDFNETHNSVDECLVALDKFKSKIV